MVDGGKRYTAYSGVGERKGRLTCLGCCCCCHCSASAVSSAPWLGFLKADPFTPSTKHTYWKQDYACSGKVPGGSGGGKEAPFCLPHSRPTPRYIAGCSIVLPSSCGLTGAVQNFPYCYKGSRGEEKGSTILLAPRYADWCGAVLSAPMAG